MPLISLCINHSKKTQTDSNYNQNLSFLRLNSSLPHVRTAVFKLLNREAFSVARIRDQQSHLFVGIFIAVSSFQNISLK